MDTSLLNSEEHFSTYSLTDDTDELSSSDDNRAIFQGWDDERELNGDIGLIPASSILSEPWKSLSDFADENPTSYLFQRMLEWTTASAYVGSDDTFCHDSISNGLPIVTEPNEPLNPIGDIGDINLELDNFDLSCFLNDTTIPEVNITIPEVNKTIPEVNNVLKKRQVKSTGKKMDLQACKYIIEDKTDKLDTSDEIDVETISEGTSLPVLEANDAFSLLEQFEASQTPISGRKRGRFSDSDFTSLDSASLGIMAVREIPSRPVEIFEKVPEAPIEIFEDVMIKPKMGKKIEVPAMKQEVIDIKPEVIETTPEVSPPKKQVSDATPPQVYAKSKHILAALPQELIARINESGKRKPITVIPPIPNRKRTAVRSVDTASKHRNKVAKISNEQVHIDHDYCAPTSVYPKDPSKDSGFQSEEDDRAVIRNQPTVKTADGKLMVSLLKVNTIRNNNNAQQQKKKLNLEEYKKRRFINSNTTSQSNSPISSTCSSPLPEDENLKYLKHQEKLMKMATDLLNTSAKSSKSPKLPHQTQQTKPVRIRAKIVETPPDLEVKTYVSIGTNTDISSINSNKSILASAKQLEDIKPLLQKNSDKINSNSFITSLIANIPKVKTQVSTYVKSPDQEVVREDMIIQYLKKDRVPVETTHTGTQTTFSDNEDSTECQVGESTKCRYRRRIDGRRRSTSSSSSGSSTRSARRRRRSRSQSPRHSRHSESSSSDSSRSCGSRSRSRSRTSFSPQHSHQYKVERMSEVEERRVVYVGRIADGTTKKDLRRRFNKFGHITAVGIYFREFGDNYGFVTFADKEDAYQAIEHGNDHAHPKYELSFGGRRMFCQTSYSDLDNMRDDEYGYYQNKSSEDNSFDALLRAAQEKLRKRNP